MERAQVFLELDLNKYSVSVDLLVNGKNFCGNGSHLWRFLRLTSPEMEPPSENFRHGQAPEEERELRTLALVADEV